MSKHTPGPNDRCAKRVYGGGSVLGYPCTKAPQHFENGKWWCCVHCDAACKARQKKSRERYEEWSSKHNAEQRRAVRRDQCESALSGIPDPARFVAAARELMAQSDATLDHVEDADAERVQNQCTLCFTYRKNLRDKIKAFRAADAPS